MPSSPSIAETYIAGHPDILARFPCPREAWARTAAERGDGALGEEDRQELRAFNEVHGAPPEALARIDRLADPRARVVIGGQQAGIALGPLYTLYKALGTALLARRLEERLSIPVVPLFWIASEDHDFEEARVVSWLSQSGEIASFAYAPDALVEGRSVGDIPIEPSLHGLLTKLRDTTADTEFRAGVMGWLGRAMDGSANLESFFARLMLSLLGRFGIPIVAPRLGFLRRQAVRLFQQELERPGAMTRRVIEAGESLRRLGFAPALHRHPSDVNFFYHEDGLRGKLTWDNGGLALHAGSGPPRPASPDEILQSVRENPQRLSCNVVTRPLCQDSALPTLGCVAGPGEIAYFAQLREVYEEAQVFMPIIAPRPRALLIDARTRRFLQKAGATPEALLADGPDEAMRRLAETNDRAGDLKAVEDAAAHFAAAVASLRERLDPMPPAIESAVGRLADGCEKGLATVRRRLEQELARKDDALRSQAARVLRWLRPEGRPQERVFSALAPLLVNYGFEALDRLAAGLDPEATALQLIHLEDSRESGTGF